MILTVLSVHKIFIFNLAPSQLKFSMKILVNKYRRHENENYSSELVKTLCARGNFYGNFI